MKVIIAEKLIKRKVKILEKIEDDFAYLYKELFLMNTGDTLINNNLKEIAEKVNKITEDIDNTINLYQERNKNRKENSK